MSWSFYVLGGIVVVIVAFSWRNAYLTRKRIQAEMEHKASSEALKEVEDAKKIRDKLESDSDFAQRVRDRFTRK